MGVHMKTALKSLPVLFLLVAFAMMPLYSQGSKETVVPKGEEKVTLTFVEVLTSPSRTKQLQDIIADYEKLHPNITINLVSPPYEQADNKLTMMLNSNQELDIVEVRDHTIKQFVNNKKIIDLTPYLEKWDGYKDLLPLTVEAAKTVDNTPYLLPQFFYIKGLFVRTDVLAKYGITEMPKTLDEMYADAKNITGKVTGQYGYGFRGKGSPFKISDLLILADVPNISKDNIYRTDDGEFSFNTPEAKKSLTAYKDLFEKAAPSDSVNWGFNEQVNGFISGTTPFLVQDPDTVSMIGASLDASQYTVIPMPVGKTGKAYLDYGFAGLGIPTSSKHPDEAWNFISYVVSAEVNAKFCKEYGPLPVHASTYQTDPFFSSGVYKAWETEMSQPDTYVFVKYPLESAKYPAWAQTEEPSMQAFVLGQTQVDDLVGQWETYWK